MCVSLFRGLESVWECFWNIMWVCIYPYIFPHAWFVYRSQFVSTYVSLSSLPTCVCVFACVCWCWD